MCIWETWETYWSAYWHKRPMTHELWLTESPSDMHTCVYERHERPIDSRTDMSERQWPRSWERNARDLLTQRHKRPLTHELWLSERPRDVHTHVYATYDSQRDLEIYVLKDIRDLLTHELTCQNDNPVIPWATRSPVSLSTDLGLCLWNRWSLLSLSN